MKTYRILLSALLCFATSFSSAQQSFVLLGTYNGTLVPIVSSASGPVISNAPTVIAYGYSPTGVAWGQVVSGIVATGTAGQTCLLTAFNNSSTATATVRLTGVNTIAPNTSLQITSAGIGATAAPTSAIVGNGTATCSGTATILTGLGAYVPLTVDVNGSLVPNFVTNEVVAGGPTNFTLARTPIVGTVQLFSGSAAIWPGMSADYTISGAAITTNSPITAGALRASYRY